MLKVVIIGANGLVGKGIFDLLKEKKDITLLKVTRENISDFNNIECDVIINANGSGKKGWCNENPSKSFDTNCYSLYKVLDKFTPKRYILISSVDVYPFTNSVDTTFEDITIDPIKLSPYCLHKYIAEMIIKNNFSDFLILRLSNVIGPGLKKNVLFDLTRKRNLFLSPFSKMNFIDTETIAEVVYQNLLKCKYSIMNCAAQNSLKVSDIIENLDLSLYYKDSFKSNLPLFSYEINTTRLSKVFEIGSSEEYVEKYIISKKK